MIERWQFGTRSDGRIITAFKLTSALGFQAVILDQGAILQSLRLPNGHNIAVGFETWAGYEKDEAYVGRIIGPNANRIANAQFKIGEDLFQLLANDGAYNLHSGPDGFDTRMWTTAETANGLRLKLETTAAITKFPGETQAFLDISLIQNRLRLDMRVTTNQSTPVNLTWHPYWNLGTNSRIDDHNLCLETEYRTDFQTGNKTLVKDTRHDFRRSHPLGGIEIDSNYHNVKRARLIANQTMMTVTSSLPDMQIYTGDTLDPPRSGIALEPQFQPNDINLAQQSLLPAGQVSNQWIEYVFHLS